MTKRTKQIIISSVIIVIAFVVFKVFFSSNVPSDTTLVADQTGSTDISGGQAILVLLNNLNKVTLDESVFSDNVFTSLVDFERPIQDQVIGRQNPFLPIGVDNSATVSLSKSTSTIKVK